MNAISFKLSTKKRAQAEALHAGPDWVSRRAKLFEAGEYADKGVTVTNEDLLQLAQSFAAPLPVLVEHSDSPLEIGLLTSVEALGPELFGTVSLTPEANALVERSGARSLSVGIAADLSVIREISLVRNPRVATAQLFAGEVRFGGALIAQEAAAPTRAGQEGETQRTFGNDEELTWRVRYERLASDQARQEAKRRVAGWLSESRITPAQAPFVEALLCIEDQVAFGDERMPVAKLVEAMNARQPALSLFGELVPTRIAEESSAEALMLPEEAEFYRRHFPGVSLAEIAKKR